MNGGRRGRGRAERKMSRRGRQPARLVLLPSTPPLYIPQIPYGATQDASRLSHSSKFNDGTLEDRREAVLWDARCVYEVAVNDFIDILLPTLPEEVDVGQVFAAVTKEGSNDPWTAFPADVTQ